MQYLTSLDLNRNELQNVRLQHLATAPASPVTGLAYYSTADDKLVVREGAAWVSFALDDHTHNFWDGPEHDAHDHSAALGSAALFDLGDAGGPAPADGNALLWSVANSRWEAGDVSSGSHSHDDAYYTEAEVDAFLAGKSDTSHTHTTDWGETADIDTIAFGQAKAAGVLNEVARADHSHDTSGFASSGHNHDATYVNESDHTKAAHDALNIDADTLDGLDSVAFEKVANKGAVNGYASLDGGGKIPSTQLPALAITDTFVVASQAAMLALTAETGDVAVRTDESKSYILEGTDPSVLGDWQELLSPTDGVQSVTGGTGITSSGGTNPSISITAGGVGPTQLATNAVTNAKMADNSVGTNELIDSTVTEAKLAFTRTKRVAGTLGDGVATSIAVTHNLGTRDVIAMVYRAASPYDVVFCDVEQTDANTTTFKFAAAPASGEYRYVIVA